MTKKIRYCNFCYRNEKIVKTLIRGIGECYICRDCIEFGLETFKSNEDKKIHIKAVNLNRKNNPW